MKRYALWAAVFILVALVAVVLFNLYTAIMPLLEASLEPVPVVMTVVPSRTPLPTFTPTATPTDLPTAPPTENFSTATATRVIAPSTTPTEPAPPPDTPTAIPTATPLVPELSTDSTVNLRGGPSTLYDVVGSLNPNTLLPIIGRVADGSWWQVEAAGQIAWVADSVVQANNTENVPVIDGANLPPVPTPRPTPTPAEPTATPKPQYQYEPTGWYADTNYGLTRFLGSITDVNGNPVDGVFVQAQCGSYKIISNPSGPVGWGVFNESATWAPGFYDLTINRRPIPCKWFLTVVYTTDKEIALQNLSEEVEIETTVEQSIIVANWRKNW